MHSKKTFGAVCALLLLCGLPVQAQIFNPETMTLKNGLQIVVLPNHRAPVVTHMVWVKAGAMDDPWGRSGIAHFCEHLMFKGTPTHPEGEYSKLISHMGGQENAFTTNDYTAFYATVGKEHLPEIMALEADRFKQLQIKDSQVATERQVILKEREQRTENDPVAAFFENVNALLYPNHPYQRPTIGWRNEMELLDRKDAEEFFKAHYSPNNLVVVISGDVELSDIKDLAEKAYGNLPNRPVKPHYIGRPIMLRSDIAIEKKSPLVRQVIWSKHRLVAASRPENIADSDALLAVQKILGDSRTGRLYRRLVIKDKIASAASISFDPDGVGPQRFAIVMMPAPNVDLNKIDAAIEDEIKKISTQGVTAQEVENASKSMQIEAIYARDSVTGPAMEVGSALASGLDLKTIEAWPTRMKNLSKTTIDQAAKTLFAPDVAWVKAVIKPEASTGGNQAMPLPVSTGAIR